MSNQLCIIIMFSVVPRLLLYIGLHQEPPLQLVTYFSYPTVPVSTSLLTKASVDLEGSFQTLRGPVFGQNSRNFSPHRPSVRHRTNLRFLKLIWPIVATTFQCHMSSIAAITGQTIILSVPPVVQIKENVKLKKKIIDKLTIII